MKLWRCQWHRETLLVNTITSSRGWDCFCTCICGRCSKSLFYLFAQFPWPLCRSFKCSVFSRKNWGGKNQLARKERAKACCVGFVRVDKYKIKIQNPEAPQHIILNFIMPLFPLPFLFLPLDFRTMNLCLSEGHTFVKNCSYFVLSLSL